jgi:pSer/pThr/pTyr-binding forkhead associated (FHA) protein
MPQETTETEFLDLDTTESRILIGFVNGSEVRIPLDRLPLTVGKKSGISDIILDDQSVSRMHARFEEHNGKVCVCDLNSTNGTLRNGEMIDMNRFIALEVGDKLKIGKSCFTYC